jgi:membrane associated rhomboid family serine protease
VDSGIVTNWSESTTRTPFATIVLGLVCLIALAVYSGLSPVLQQTLIDMWGMRPIDVANQLEQSPSQWWGHTSLTLFTALFIHANWLHLVGNLAYLWVFGMAVEQRLGWLSLAAIFSIGGAFANVMVVLMVPQLETPVIGASGAVSAVVGAYLGLFPSRRIGLYLPLGLYLQFARVPALLVIGSWFTLQLVYTVIGPINGSVAWWTHLVGFAFGLSITLLVKALALVRFQK